MYTSTNLHERFSAFPFVRFPPLLVVLLGEVSAPNNEIELELKTKVKSKNNLSPYSFVVFLCIDVDDFVVV